MVIETRALGGLLGVGIGAGLLQAAPSLIPPGLLPNAVTLTFDGRVLTFCAATALLVGLLFGVAPAWQATGVSLVQAIASGGRATKRGGRLRGLLVVGEIAAAVLVLSGAGLLLRTLIALGRVDPGYRADDVLTVTLTLPMPGPGASPRYRTPEALRQFYDAVEREIERRPGVRRSAWGSALPLDGWWFAQPFDIAGDEPQPAGRKNAASYHMVSPAYLATLGIPIVTGRGFTNGDTTDGVPVCIVSEAFVRQYLGGRQPLGRRISVPLMSFGPPTTVEREIVGVARQVKGQPDEPREQPQIYVPLAQNAWWSASLVVQPDRGPAETLVSTVRAAIADVDKERPVRQMRTLRGIAWEATSRPRFRAVLVATFAALALALSMVGVFGVLAYSVQQRTREFGVRIALGAGVSDVMRLVLQSAARMTVIGAAVGLACAGVLSRLIATLLFGVPPLDPVTFGAAAAVLLITAAVAAAAPALRAARVDPIVALRNE